MRKCKSMLTMLVLLCTLFVGSMVYAASTSASVSISKDNYSKSSSSVGVSTSANFSASNYSSSTKHMTMEHMLAGQDGRIHVNLAHPLLHQENIITQKNRVKIRVFILI